MSTEHAPYLSPADYLLIERAAETKSEYFRGQMYAMAGGTGDHSTIASNVGAALFAVLGGRGCRTLNSDMRIHIPGTGLYTYADGAVACEPPIYLDASKDTLLNPILLFEVLSPSSQDYDRGGKFAQNRTISSFREYLTVAQDRVLVEQWSLLERHWTLTEHDSRGDVVSLHSLGVSLRVGEIYRDIWFD